MPELTFQIDAVEPVAFAAVPTIAFKLRIVSRESVDIRAISLQCQIQIESTRRRYHRDEQARLIDLFGEPHRWGQTLRSMPWTQVNTQIPAFKNEAVINLSVPCSFDFNVAANKYFAALQEGEVPLNFLFSGTIFYTAANGQLQIEQVPWEKETKARLPVPVWKQMMSMYYPNEKWLPIRGDIFERIEDYKRRRSLATFDQALEGLLSTANHVDDRRLMAGKAS
jgi:hypothetical protein